MKFEIVVINWVNQTLIAKDTFVEVERSNSINYPNSLYQAYGDSIIYGENKLLYIGKTNDSERRLSEHVKTDFNRILNLSLTIGQIETVDQENIIEKLKIIESLLICYLKPSYNSENIKDIYTKSKGHPILILNKGIRGSLPLECSNFWWLSEETKSKYQVNNN